MDCGPNSDVNLSGVVDESKRTGYRTYSQNPFLQCGDFPADHWKRKQVLELDDGGFSAHWNCIAKENQTSLRT